MSKRSSTVSIWGVELDTESLSSGELRYLNSLPESLPTVDWVWEQIDSVWDGLGLDNSSSLDDQPVGEFYRHPVWLMNGIFSHADPESVGHREAIAEYVASLNAKRVADFGGGFGTLAVRIHQADPNVAVDIVEPFPSQAARRRIASYEGISLVSGAPDRTYDVATAEDVLEHVEEPVDLAVEIVKSVEPGGIAIFASNFTPVIKCHLPSTFHLLHTFPVVMRALGLDYQGVVDGAGHAQIYRVGQTIHPNRAKRAEKVSQTLEPAVRLTRSLVPRRLRSRIRDIVRSA